MISPINFAKNRVTNPTSVLSAWKKQNMKHLPFTQMLPRTATLGAAISMNP